MPKITLDSKDIANETNIFSAVKFVEMSPRNGLLKFNWQ